MQISSRLTMAVHVMVFLDIVKSQGKITSDFLASSVNVNPVVIRRLLTQLKSAGLVEVSRGNDGIRLQKPLSEITMLDLYNAVECVENGTLFHFHDNPSGECPIGRNIRSVLDPKLDRIQHVMEEEMAQIFLSYISDEIREKLTAVKS